MKKSFILLGLILISFSCSQDDGDGSINTSELHQFTPDQADWSTFYSKPLSEGFLSHDPDGWTKFTPSDWEKSKWDGEIYDPTKMTQSEFAEAICPDVDMVRGIRELFYETKPFKDNENPTKAEVDEWHRISINHIRSLVGYNDERSKIEKDSCLFIRALWGDQRKHTTIWEDAGYPITGNTNSIHYGASFIPDKIDQQPYFAEGDFDCSAGGDSEGVFVRSRAHIPWATKWIRPFCTTIQNEGFWGGHTGPWFHRTKFGFSFWDNNVDNNTSFTLLRAKWGGTPIPNQHIKP